MYVRLSVLHSTSTLRLHLLFAFQLLQRKGPNKCSKRRGRKRNGSEQKYYARTVYHTKGTKDRGFTLQYAHGDRDGTEDMAFSSTFMFGGRERQDDYASTD